MHANEDYWASAPSGVSVTISPTSATPVSASGDANLTNGVNAALANPSLCDFTSTSSYCTAADMAGYDLVQWEEAMNSVLSGATSQISCQSANLQIFCTIDITWQETIANANSEEQGSAALQNQSYQLVVEP
jgi:type IV pilus assembly protein PilV